LGCEPSRGGWLRKLRRLLAGEEQVEVLMPITAAMTGAGPGAITSREGG
jgi:hypothetical protein